MQTFSGNIVDVVKGETFPGKPLMSRMEEFMKSTVTTRTHENHIIPGFIDAHDSH